MRMRTARSVLPSAPPGTPALPPSPPPLPPWWLCCCCWCRRWACVGEEVREAAGSANREGRHKRCAVSQLSAGQAAAQRLTAALASGDRLSGRMSSV